jgi:hypothetical protein
VAERVDQRGEFVKAQLGRVPTPMWFALLIAGGILTAALVQLVGTGGSGVSSQLVSLPKGATSAGLPVRYEVTAPAHHAVQCVLEAVGKDHAVVGTFTDSVPARTDDARRTTRDIVITTTALAVSADIDSCTVVRAH